MPSQRARKRRTDRTRLAQKAASDDWRAYQAQAPERKAQRDAEEALRKQRRRHRIEVGVMVMMGVVALVSGLYVLDQHVVTLPEPLRTWMGL